MNEYAIEVIMQFSLYCMALLYYAILSLYLYIYLNNNNNRKYLFINKLINSISPNNINLLL